MAKLILASHSPRRAELLAQIGLTFEQKGVSIDETPLENERPETYLSRIAEQKYHAALKQYGHEQGILIVADTIVVYSETILGKPKTKDESIQMLSLLSGKSHQVSTIVYIGYQDKRLSDCVTSEVLMREILSDEMEAYWQTGEPLDKAGSYAIQGIGSIFVKAVQGSYSNIVGLPLYETAQLLKQAGVNVL